MGLPVWVASQEWEETTDQFVIILFLYNFYALLHANDKTYGFPHVSPSRKVHQDQQRFQRNTTQFSSYLWKWCSGLPAKKNKNKVPHKNKPGWNRKYFRLKNNLLTYHNNKTVSPSEYQDTFHFLAFFVQDVSCRGLCELDCVKAIRVVPVGSVSKEFLLNEKRQFAFIHLIIAKTNDQEHKTNKKQKDWLLFSESYEIHNLWIAFIIKNAKNLHTVQDPLDTVCKYFQGANHISISLHTGVDSIHITR
jgi:hypothetical protein